jgi:hypothetical protein
MTSLSASVNKLSRDLMGAIAKKGKSRNCLSTFAKINCGFEAKRGPALKGSTAERGLSASYCAVIGSRSHSWRVREVPV